MRALTERIGGDLARFYLALAHECPTVDRFRFPSASVSDIAEWTHDAPKAVRRRLIQLERLGYIAWTRPTNQHICTGELRLLVDLEQVKPPPDANQRQRLILKPNEVASPAAAKVTKPISPAVGLPVGLPETDRATLVKCELPITRTITYSPPDALGNARTESGGDSFSSQTTMQTTQPPEAPNLEASPADGVNVAERTNRHHVTTIQKAAGMVVSARERTYGLGGFGALRKVAESLEAELGDKCAEWLADGCEPRRIAAALADRFTGTNQGAVPWSPGGAPPRLAEPPAVGLETEHVGPMTETDWERLPQGLRASLAERYPTVVPAAAAL